MSGKRIRWTLLALRRLDEIGSYIEKDNPDAAARVVARILTAVDMLVELPASGRPGRIKGTREIVLADIAYIIPYRVGRDIVVVTVIYAHQRWPSQFQSATTMEIAHGSQPFISAASKPGACVSAAYNVLRSRTSFSLSSEIPRSLTAAFPVSGLLR
ncbi:addiction module RelE/StbE family toxin [Rhizobium sp. BK619]|uniref:Addiction module toxin, RelE/StbE family n=1 Tax=Rhizobium leguminosarum bv. trifolii (strain WSM2304) TaxID=395492 RepID=A0ABF7QRI2_RHILW|nr:addiction module toxin, RelE/StbE family [Rhizobium leguminosarum bv. trifolii WSM2304]MBB3650309.1 addiction module RelE/StbE family toxin [Rhizobium sp. BK619]